MGKQQRKSKGSSSTTITSSGTTATVKNLKASNFPFSIHPNHYSKNMIPIWDIHQDDPDRLTNRISNKLYDTILSEESQIQLARKYIFDANMFHYYYHQCYENNMNARKQMRKMIQIGTIGAFLRGKYFVPVKIAQEINKLHDQIHQIDTTNVSEKLDIEDVDLSKEVSLPYQTVYIDKKMIIKSVQSTRLYRSSEFIPTIKNPKEKNEPYTTIIQVVDGDCLEAALVLKANQSFSKKTLKPAMLVMCSESNPGGGYKKGSAAQEENICRRTNLFMCLEDPYRFDPNRDWSYPIYGVAGVYVPDCIVIRDAETGGIHESSYAFRKKPESVSMIAVSALSNPPLEKHVTKRKREESGEIEEIIDWRLPAKTAQVMKQKIRNICRIALSNGHDSLVLSALGCGAFQNPPRHIAMIFKEVLMSKELINQFKIVLFAIYNDSNANFNAANDTTITNYNTGGSTSLKGSSQQIQAGNVHAFYEIFHGDKSQRAPTLKQWSKQFLQPHQEHSNI